MSNYMSWYAYCISLPTLLSSSVSSYFLSFSTFPNVFLKCQANSYRIHIWRLIGISMNLSINLEIVAILIKLSLPKTEHRIFLHLISTCNIFQVLMYISCTSFVRFIRRFRSLGHKWNISILIFTCYAHVYFVYGP